MEKNAALTVYLTKNGILLQKLYIPTVRKHCSSDREKLLKFKAEGREFLNQQGDLEKAKDYIKQSYDMILTCESNDEWKSNIKRNLDKVEKKLELSKN